MLNITCPREMQIKTTMEYHFTPTRMAVIKSQIITCVGEDMNKSEPSYSAGRNVIGQLLWKTVWQVLEQLNIVLPYDLAILLLHRIKTQEKLKTCSHKILYLNVYSSIIHNSQKNGNNPNVHRLMNG